jgi:hypothetical protein
VSDFWKAWIMQKRTEGVLTVPAIAVSFLPKVICPMCSPAYTALLSALSNEER